MPLLAMSSSEPFVWTRTLPKNQPQLLLRMIYTDEDVEHFAIRAEPEPPVKEISDFNGQDRNSFWIDPGDLEKILTEAANRLVGEGIRTIINRATEKKTDGRGGVKGLKT